MVIHHWAMLVNLWAHLSFFWLPSRQLFVNYWLPNSRVDWHFTNYLRDHSSAGALVPAFLYCIHDATPWRDC